MLALAALVRIRVGLNYSHENLVKMIAIYTLAALPFFTGGAVISLAITRLRKQVNVVYGADLIGAAVGCLLLLPLLNRFGAPGVVLLAAVLGGAAALLFSPARTMARTAMIAALAVGIPGGAAADGLGAVRREQHQRARRRHGALREVEFVFARGRVRPVARRLVAQLAIQG